MKKPTPAELKQALDVYMGYLSAKGASKGGHARARKLTAAQRSESARLAAQARWKKKRKAR